jgi:hypothetical protein
VPSIARPQGAEEGSVNPAHGGGRPFSCPNRPGANRAPPGSTREKMVPAGYHLKKRPALGNREPVDYVSGPRRANARGDLCGYDKGRRSALRPCAKIAADAKFRILEDKDVSP